MAKGWQARSSRKRAEEGTPAQTISAPPSKRPTLRNAEEGDLADSAAAQPVPIVRAPISRTDHNGDNRERSADVLGRLK